MLNGTVDVAVLHKLFASSTFTTQFVDEIEGTNQL